jgi:ATP-dependent helicase/nuclease subunit A
MNGLTGEQEAAVQASGDVLVVAGAGTGKTRTLVERCLRRIEDGQRPVGIDRMLVVTFTEAAAAELRKRIRGRFEAWLVERPGDERLTEQLALLESARISTLHGFCLGLVRDHFHRLGIDPEVVVLSEEQSALVARETLDGLLRRQYEGAVGEVEVLQQLVLDHGRGWDEPVRQLILRWHRYTRTLRDPAGWFERERARLEQVEPEHWLGWLLEGFAEWRGEWLEALGEQSSPPAQICRGILDGLSVPIARDAMAAALAAILEADGDEVWPKGQKTRLRKPMASFFAEAAFLESLAGLGVEGDPLRQDWEWLRKPTLALLELTRRFGVDYDAAKRALGAVDFSDLEQHALELLWNRAGGKPTAVAEQLRRQLDLVFVDEYQDINEAQDAILRAVSREGGYANRFLVGDVKQSIYRFRLANPRIFQGYMAAWSESDATRHVLHLADNFRSHERILEFVNRLFGGLMRSEVGGVAYDTPQHLRFGAAEERTALGARAGDSPRIELHLLLTEAKSTTEPDSAEFEVDPRPQAEREAECIGLRLRELRASGFEVWDSAGGKMRGVRWQDMAILMRSPSGKTEAYAKVFERLRIPLQVARGGFYETAEVTDLLGVLQVLDNPLQDLPLLGVLRAPWVGLTADELATVRLARRGTYYWTALRQFHRQHRPGGKAATAETQTSRAGLVGTTWAKVDRFLAGFRTWRRRIRQEPLSGCLEFILDQTGYEEWLRAQPRGDQRQANVQRLLALTRQFDEFQRQGLYRFLRFVEAQTTAGVDAEPAAPAGVDAVRLSSIHQSKGLEFPVVVVADLGKPFNFQDLRHPVILDEQYGLCPQVRPPGLGGRYPSLPYWLAQRRQRRETIGEELRLLYVACTRACDLLLLSGSAAAQRIETRWQGSGASGLSLRGLLTAGSYLDWLGAVLPGWTGQGNWLESGTGDGLVWRVYSPRIRTGDPEETDDGNGHAEPSQRAPTIEQVRNLERRISWRYPFMAATLEPAKTTVSALRRRALEDQEMDSVIWQPRGARGEVSGAEVGVAYHLLLERLSMAGAGDRAALRDEARRMAADGLISTAQFEALDLDAIAAFWQSPVGSSIAGQEARSVHRELPFTARFGLTELAELDLIAPGERMDGEQDEWVIVQGVVDLAVILDKEIWVLDFKTDRVDDLAGKIAGYTPQLRLYGLALDRIYRRPVTRLWIHFFAVRETIWLLGV